MPSTTAFRLSLAVQLLTVFALGIMAGFFGTYSANVNLAMLQLDGPTYAMVQSSFNRNVRHALFFAFFFGPLPLGLLTLATSWRLKDRARVLPAKTRRGVGVVMPRFWHRCRAGFLRMPGRARVPGRRRAGAASGSAGRARTGRR